MKKNRKKSESDEWLLKDIIYSQINKKISVLKILFHDNHIKRKPAVENHHYESFFWFQLALFIVMNNIA